MSQQRKTTAKALAKTDEDQSARKLAIVGGAGIIALAVASIIALPTPSNGAELTRDSAPIAQKTPNRSASCVGSAPADGMLFADLDTLCLLAAEVGTARLERDTNGEDYIAATTNGINYAVDVYNCDPQCADLSFTASFEMDGPDVALMNEWNASRRFGKAYIRDDGDSVIQFAINTRHGIAVETFRDDLLWWQEVLEDYTSFIGFQ